MSRADRRAAQRIALAALLVGVGCGKARTVSPPGVTNPPPAPPQGLVIELQGVDVPASGAPTVTFRVTDGTGAPVDLIQEIKNGAASPAVTPRTTAPRFTLAELQPSGDYLSDYDRAVAGKPYLLTDGGAQQSPALASATQAVADAVPTADPALSTRLVSQGNGVYTYTLSVPTRTDLDRTQTWTVATWATRTLSADDAGHPAHATLNFVPGGGTAGKLEVVTDAACNACHTRLEAHDRRTGTQLCITCHSPQSTDPESGNTVDFKVMIHKLHSGASLPTVVQGTPFFIVGFAPGSPTPLPASAVQDYSDVGFPRPLTDCGACHQGANADRARVASLTACTSCHDNVKFLSPTLPACVAGATADCDHPVDTVPPTADCTTCHTATAVAQAHTDVVAAQAASFKYEILGVTMGGDRKPTVTLRVTNPATGVAYVLNGAGGGTVDPAWSYTSSARPVGGASRLFVDIAWPVEAYTNAGSGAKSAGGHDVPGQPVSINVLGTATPVAGQAGAYQVVSPVAVPAGQAFAVVLEGHPGLKLSDTSYARIAVTNDVKFFDAGGAASAAAHPLAVSVDRCNACHGLLSAHGSNRTGTVQACAVCHNADATDAGAIADAGAEVPEVPIDLKWLIHGIHGDRIRQTPFTVIGFGGSQNVFPIGFPGEVATCSICHEGNTYEIPLPSAVLDTTVGSGANPADPADNVRLSRTVAACTSCHDQARFDEASLGLGKCNVTATGPCLHSGGPQPSDQSCATCHASGAQWDVAVVHPVNGLQ